MGPEAVGDEEQSSTITLPLFSIPATIMMSMNSPERPGMLTPPLRSSASVPFRWEEEPGKPKPCTTLITLPTTTNSSSKTDLSRNKCLELPPRLLLMDNNHATAANATNNNIITKLSSPTTVLEGPYYYMSRSSRFQAPSFRMSGDCYGSFRKSLISPERDGDDGDDDDDQFGALMRSNSKTSATTQKEKGVIGSWRKKGLKSNSNKREVGVGGGGSYVFPSSVDGYSECSREEEASKSKSKSNSKSSSSTGGDKITRIASISGSGSFTSVSLSRRRFWATMYGGLKQAVLNPWRSCRKGKKREVKDGTLT